MKIVARLDLKSNDEILKRLGVNEGGFVQKVIDSEVIRQCAPYVPMDEGALTASAWSNTRIGSGLVTYNTPYARYLYYGEVFGPNFQMEIGGEMVWRSRKGVIKHPTGRMLSYNLEHHENAGPRWFDRAMADHKEDVLRAARKAAGAKNV